ncbi:hypothetical protein MA9V2_150 [Chryseobacterium phage MA9V-2]|nr:hypothetical protein MA9V2_150 [Chryseobacterium phage MA9V-2]
MANNKIHTQTLAELTTYFGSRYFELFKENIVAKFPDTELIFTHFIRESDGQEWIGIYAGYDEYSYEPGYNFIYDNATIDMIGECMADPELRKDPNWRIKYNIYFSNVKSFYDDEVILFHQNPNTTKPLL